MSSSHPPPHSSSTSPPEHEIVFLILHHLHKYDSNPAVAKALQTLESALSDIQKLPIVNDYTGVEHSLSYHQCTHRFSHITPAFLTDLLRDVPFPLLHRSSAGPRHRRKSTSKRLRNFRNHLYHQKSVNIISLLDQYFCMNMSFPIHQLTFTLLPNRFRKIKRLIGHHLPVFTTIYDQSSKFIITGSDDHLIKIWSPESMRLQHTLRGHDSNITEIVKHPTNPIIVSASSDSTLRVWDLHTAKALYVLDGGSKEVNAVQFSPCPDRPYLISGGADGTIRLWNTNYFDKGSMNIPIPPHHSRSHSHSRHTTTQTTRTNSGYSSAFPVASTSNIILPSPPHHHNSGLQLPSPPELSTNGSRSEQTCNAQSNPINVNTHNINSRSQVTDSRPIIHVSNSNVPQIASSHPAPTSNAHPSSATALVGHSSSAMPTTQGNSSQIQTQTQNPVPSSSLPTTTMNNHIINSTNNNSNTNTNNINNNTNNTDNNANNSNANANTASTRPNMAPTSSVVSGTPLYEVMSLSFNAGATRLVAGGTDGNAHLYSINQPKNDSSTGEQSTFPEVHTLTTLRGHSDGIIQVLFSHSGDRIVTAGRDGTARIWRRTKAESPMNKRTKMIDVNGMGRWAAITLDCRSPNNNNNGDNRSALSGAASGSVNGSIIPQIRRNIIKVSLCAVIWSRNDEVVLTSTSDGAIRIWNSVSGQLVRTLASHCKEVYTMQFHPYNDNLFLTAGYDGKCIFWDMSNGKQLKVFFVGDDDSSNSNSNSIDHQAAPSMADHAPMTTTRPVIIDGQFSNDGMSFVVSDTSGAITIFGVGSSKQALIAPEEQFFANEHTPIRRDEQNRVVHETTGRLWHVEPKGLLCDRNYIPHPKELQPVQQVNAATIITTDDSSCAIDQSNLQNQTASANDTTGTTSDQNHAYRTLVARANEFRANEVKRERRLIREAKIAKRQFLKEREKKSLERDVLSRSLRDFEVPDSEYEDSDKDYKADDAVLNHDESSSSSSDDEDDEDEIRPVRKGQSKARGSSSRRKDRTNLLAGAVQKRGRRSQRATRKRVNLAESGGEECEPDTTTTAAATGNKNNNEGKRGKKKVDEDSLAYEVGSHESESDDGSLSSEDRKLKNLKSKDEQGPINVNAPKRTDCTNAVPRKGLSYSNGTSHPSALNLSIPMSPSPLHSYAPLTPSLTLGGATIVKGQRRMKISTSTGCRDNYPHSTSSNPITMTNSIQDAGRHHSDGTRERRGHRTDASDRLATETHPSTSLFYSGAGGSRNPSNTTERKVDNQSLRAIHVEEQQDDAASCLGARSLTDVLRDDRRVPSMDGLRHHISTDASHHPDHSGDATASQQGGVKNGQLINMDADEHLDNMEKSLLSDSPGRITRTRARTRSGFAKVDHIENTTVPTMDIDEIAEKEVEILDAQRSKKRKRGRGRSSPNNSAGEGSSEDDGGIATAGLDGGITHTQNHTGVMDGRIGIGGWSGGGGQRLRTRRNGKVSGSAGGKCRTLEASAWLRKSDNRFTYVPQVQDEVTYFAEGHIAAVNVARSAGLEPLLDKSSYKRFGKEVLDGLTLGKDHPPLCFRIEDVSYQLPCASQKVKVAGTKGKTMKANADAIVAHSETVMVLTLRLLNGMKRKAGQTDQFVLSYFPVDTPDYLVLSSRVENALSRSWKTKDRFRILFLNENRSWQYYTGSIRIVRPTLHTVIWNTIEVEYDNEESDKGNTDLVSPWELEPYDLLQSSKEFNTSTSSFSANKGTIEPGLFHSIARELDTIRSTEMSWKGKLSWIDTVDTLATTTGYSEVVPCPMDLNIIIVRLCTGYYRHFASFNHDVKLVKSNAIRFHGEQSEIGTLTSTVCDRILELSRRIREQYLSPIHNINTYGAVQTNYNRVYSNSRATWAKFMPPSGDVGVGGAIMGGTSHTPTSSAMKAAPVSMGLRSGTQLGGFSNRSVDMSGIGQHRTKNGLSNHSINNIVNSINVQNGQNNPQTSVGSLPPTLPNVTNGASTKTIGGGRGGRTRSMKQQTNGGVRRNSNNNGKGVAGSGTQTYTQTHTQTQVQAQSHPQIYSQAQGSPTFSVSAAAGGGFSAIRGGATHVTTIGNNYGDASRSVQQHTDHGHIGHIRTSNGGHNQMLAPAPTSARGEGGGGNDDNVIGVSSTTKQMGQGTNGGNVVHIGGGGTSAGSLQAFGDITGSNFVRGYSGNGVVSPPPDGSGGVAGTISAQGNMHGTASRNRGMTSHGTAGGTRSATVGMGGGGNGGLGSGSGSRSGGLDRGSAGSGGGNRGGSGGGIVVEGSGGGGGGTHSWSRSMEGAGGMLPLQASTSDSHVVARNGRSQSPISPIDGRGDASGNAASARHDRNVAYHEHSTVSMAAAESTISCGGVDAVLQAASAESVEIATSSRAMSDGRQVR